MNIMDDDATDGDLLKCLKTAVDYFTKHKKWLDTSSARKEMSSAKLLGNAKTFSKYVSENLRRNCPTRRW